ncbi:hypothetical protein CMI41_01700 [Candidatus Pacearchaeota archaeon]|nr:hypothetical protein [Candidatus Pacearchaeota archaeon]|tara:strand:+ start:118 stop:906 length:789 start_codon:yes stop_codon:yes gene_type:complete
MMNKVGGGWTVHKLIAIILAVLVMVLIVVGAIGGGLDPMFERLEGYYDNVKAKLGLSINQTSVDIGGCGPSEDTTIQHIEEVEEIEEEAQDEIPTSQTSFMEFRICEGYCEIKDDDTVYKFVYETKDFTSGGEDLDALSKNLENYDAKEQEMWGKAKTTFKCGDTLEFNEVRDRDETSPYYGWYFFLECDLDLWKYDKEVGDYDGIWGNIKGAWGRFRKTDDRFKTYHVRSHSDNPWLSSTRSLEEIERLQDINDYFVKNCV